MTHRRFGPRAEEALRRTLKDTDDGQLTLRVRGCFFDEHRRTHGLAIRQTVDRWRENAEHTLGL